MNEIKTSRFITFDDPQLKKVILELPEIWWSRMYEYAWASSFVNDDHVVLDAACGICHPFKFHLCNILGLSKDFEENQNKISLGEAYSIWTGLVFRYDSMISTKTLLEFVKDNEFKMIIHASLSMLFDKFKNFNNRRKLYLTYSIFLSSIGRN